jgi:hypothetical protein
MTRKSLPMFYGVLAMVPVLIGGCSGPSRPAGAAAGGGTADALVQVIINGTSAASFTGFYVTHGTRCRLSGTVPATFQLRGV